MRSLAESYISSKVVVVVVVFATGETMSEKESCSVIINGKEFIRKDQIEKAEELEGMPYQIVRTQSAGVFAGYVESRTGQEVIIRNARRLWYWDGAASLSQLSQDGVTKPDSCKFPVAVDRVLLTQVIEILDCTETAKKSISQVKIWKL